MKEVKLPEIKLFGKKIALPEVEAGEKFSGEAGVGNCKGNSSGSDSDCCLVAKTVSKLEGSEAEDEKNADKQETDKICFPGEGCETESTNCRPIAEESQHPKDLSDHDNSGSVDEDSSDKQSPESENDQSDTNHSQGKNLKKPDKVLPCPRCNSMDTKFCYYNNYNVNQPRHFCKSCQRYWTAGGTMRNVPVGAGRRKNKNSASHCRHITISDALQAAQVDVTNGFHQPNIKPNGTVLSFGPDLPICDSMAAVLKLNDKKMPNGCQNGFYKHDPGNSVCGKGAENGNGLSSGLPITISNQTSQRVQNYQETVLQNVNNFPTPVTYFPNMGCPFPAPIPVPVPAICPPGFPMPIYPAPLWNCGITGAWSFPWLPPGSPVAVQKSSGSNPNSPTLGKHSRDGELLKPKNLEGDMCQDPKISEGSILIPKTLRIDDPEEAAKSSIWTTLGIKYDSVGRGGLFKALQPKSNENKRMEATSPMMLQANPAAMSRSLTFQEAS